MTIKSRRNTYKTGAGELNPNHKLSNDDIDYIRKSNDTQRSLAKLFKVGQPCIWKVQHLVTWKHI